MSHCEGLKQSLFLDSHKPMLFEMTNEKLNINVFILSILSCPAAYCRIIDLTVQIATRYLMITYTGKDLMLKVCVFIVFKIDLLSINLMLIFLFGCTYYL